MTNFNELERLPSSSATPIQHAGNESALTATGNVLSITVQPEVEQR